jgi:outer membrane lipoprotein-sorting protein
MQKRTATWIAIAALWMVAFVSGSGLAQEDPVKQLIVEMQSAYGNINDMTCHFIKEVVIEGKKVPKTKMLFKFKKTPKSIYLEFLNRYEGQKCLYIEGQNDNQMLVRPNGIMKFMTFKMDITDERAMAESTAPITQMGFQSIIETVQKWHERSLSDPAVKIDFKADFREKKRQFYRLFGRSDRNDDFLLILVDRKNRLPYKLEYRYGKNYGLYIYKDVKVNLGLTDKDFEI